VLQIVDEFIVARTNNNRANAVSSTVPYHYIMMHGPNDEASIPTKYVINAQILDVRMRRKGAKRTRPLFLPNPTLRRWKIKISLLQKTKATSTY
jgi:hypothetical protein